MRKKLLFLIVLSVFLFGFPLFAFAESVPVGLQNKQYDFVILISSLLTFMFDCIFKILNMLDDSLVKIATGNFDVPILGSLYRTMERAGMLEYRIESSFNDRAIVHAICEVSLKCTRVLRNFCIIAEDNIQNGYFPGVLRAFFMDAHRELQQYEFYQAFSSFVNWLPSTKIAESMVDFSQTYLRGHL